MDSEIVVNMGNVVGGASSQANILACAIAMGADLTMCSRELIISKSWLSRADPSLGGTGVRNGLR